MGNPLTKKELLTKFESIHGDKYDYSKIDKTKNSEKVEIICKKHGSFFQVIAYHKSGNGCPKCAGNKLLNTNEVINSFKLIHGDKYDYSNSIYINAKTQIEIKCNKCSLIFFQTPNGHKKQGNFCPSCSGKQISNREIIDRFKIIHGNKYDYSKVKYVSAYKKIEIKCNSCLKTFFQSPMNHEKGNNCPFCSKTGFKKDKEAILYYLKLKTDNDQILYKLGVTNLTLNKRFGSQLKYLIPLLIMKFNIGSSAYDLEQKILLKNKQYKYIGNSILKNGNSELFFKDIMGLDSINGGEDGI
ncbi:hypothetical protein [Aliarcobacter butzleri]|uniref:hypothetical protein n=1 Tax=Aliarcobacter butzleri TaxID=28197 RepID=UPI0021B27F27|nr:hypothetical protein [Aliarcobacter butzleri]MCT7632104.1 hypothetical protein [Aliarcobacter butzleri]